MKSVTVIEKSSGKEIVAIYAATSKGNMRYHIDGKPVPDSKFDKLYTIKTDIPELEAVEGDNGKIVVAGTMNTFGTLNHEYTHLAKRMVDVLNKHSKQPNGDYTIFVPISTFIGNGGVLTERRAIYVRVEGTSNDYKLVARYLKREGDQIIAKSASASFPIQSHVFYVEIPVTPIFK